MRNVPASFEEHRLFRAESILIKFDGLRGIFKSQPWDGNGLNGGNGLSYSRHNFSPFQQFGFQSGFEFLTRQTAQVGRKAHQGLDVGFKFRQLAVRLDQQDIHRSVQLLDVLFCVVTARIVLSLVQRALRHRHPPSAPADCSRPGTAVASPRPRSCESPAPLPLCFSPAQTAALPLAAVPPATYPPGETTLPCVLLPRIPRPWPARIQSVPVPPQLAPGSIFANDPKSDSRLFETATPQTEFPAIQTAAN